MLDARASGSPAPLRDARLPAVEALLGPAAPELMEAAVRPHGGSIGSLRPSFVEYWPGSRIHVRYDATVIYPSGPVGDTLVAVGGGQGTPPGPAVPVELGDGTMVGVWRFPQDPALRGLPAATDPTFVRELLAEVGIAEQAPRIRTVGYSPLSRAVIEVAAERPTRVVVQPGRGPRWARAQPLVYLKVRRRERAVQMRRAHESLTSVVPIARCLVFREELGLLVLEPLSGEPLWDRLVGGAAVPAPEELLELVEGLDGISFPEASPRPTVSQSVLMNAAMLLAVAPESAEAIESFLEAFGEDIPQPTVNIHGDFHELQVLLDPHGRVGGLLDLDDAGRGQRIDDLAMLVGRLSCFAQTEPDPHGRVQAYVDRLLEGFSQHVDGRELRRRAAGVALNHATGPFRFQAHHWRAQTRTAIDRARRMLPAAT